MRSAALCLALVLALGAQLSCKSSGTSQSPASDATPAKEPTKLEKETAKLEKRRDSDKDDFETHMSLGWNYYLRARAAFDQGDKFGYLKFLTQGQKEALEAARIEPDSARPHSLLGVVSLYEGKIDVAQSSLHNAIILNRRERYERRNAGYLLDLAQVEIFRGEVGAARRLISKARKMNVRADSVDFVDILCAWQEGDLVEARDIFASASLLWEKKLYGKDEPSFAEGWDGAPLPKKMETFDDFTAACCHNPACGPYMPVACKRAKQTVAELPKPTTPEGIEGQLALERERQRQLKEIYDQKKNVKIQVEPKPGPSNADEEEEPSGSEPKR
jgi:tetratricopeptide (TPR) repeat protein